MENFEYNYSIIIPHYNIPDLLARCLRSIPEREDVQVIVVDDNSPNQGAYLSTIPELKRKNVEFYPNKDGLGAGHVRNVGLSHAKGKWIVFSDSDDFFVENISEIFDKYVDETSDILYFNIKSCDSNDVTKILSENRERLFELYKNTGDDRYFRICYTEPWGKFIKHQLIKDNHIQFQETKANNDLLFAMKSGLSAKTVLPVNVPLYWYVYREGSLGHSAKLEPIEKIRDRVRAWNSSQELLNSNGIKTAFYLPTIPCVKLIRRSHYAMYFKILLFMKKEGLNYWRVVIDTIRHYYRRLFGKQLIDFERMFIP